MCAIAHTRESGQIINDIDLFFYGLSSDKIVPRFKKLVNDIMQQLKGSYLAIYKSNSNVFELLRYTSNGDKKKTTHKIQIILVKNSDMKSIIDKFDLDASKVIFDGVDIYFNSQSFNSYKFMINCVNEEAYTNTYDFRLQKYFDCGFTIVIPEFDIASFKEKILLGSCIFDGCELHNKKITSTYFRVSDKNNDGSDGLYQSSNLSDIDTTLKYIARINKDDKIINYTYIENCGVIDDDKLNDLFNGKIKFVSGIDKLLKNDWYGHHRCSK